AGHRSSDGFGLGPAIRGNLAVVRPAERAALADLRHLDGGREHVLPREPLQVAAEPRPVLVALNVVARLPGGHDERVEDRLLLGIEGAVDCLQLPSESLAVCLGPSVCHWTSPSLLGLSIATGPASTLAGRVRQSAVPCQVTPATAAFQAFASKVSGWGGA